MNKSRIVLWGSQRWQQCVSKILLKQVNPPSSSNVHLCASNKRNGTRGLLDNVCNSWNGIFQVDNQFSGFHGRACLNQVSDQHYKVRSRNVTWGGKPRLVGPHLIVHSGAGMMITASFINEKFNNTIRKEGLLLCHQEIAIFEKSSHLELVAFQLSTLKKA